MYWRTMKEWWKKVDVLYIMATWCCFTWWLVQCIWRRKRWHMKEKMFLWSESCWNSMGQIRLFEKPWRYGIACITQFKSNRYSGNYWASPSYYFYVFTHMVFCQLSSFSCPGLELTVCRRFLTNLSFFWMFLTLLVIFSSL